MNTNDPISTLFGLRAKSAIVTAQLSALGFLAGLGFCPAVTGSSASRDSSV